MVWAYTTFLSLCPRCNWLDGPGSIVAAGKGTEYGIYNLEFHAKVKCVIIQQPLQPSGGTRDTTDKPTDDPNISTETSKKPVGIF